MSRASVVMLCSVVMLLLTISAIRLPAIQSFSYGFLGSNVTETKILFVGDVMLGRYVETLINEKGSDYPFMGMGPLANRYDQVIGNFEAPITAEHIQTKPESLNFSIATSSIQTLNKYFTAFSLANNHTFDNELEGLSFTRSTLATNSIQTFGDPNGVGSTSVTYIYHGEQIIALVGINAVTGLDATSTVHLFSELNSSSDMQIVYVHWGTEYQSTHNEAQEVLAHILIDAGADAIIGHHPHVIQDIDMYKGAPIFYSLGNFVFDQYFDDNVTVGLGVELVLRNTEITYRLIPFTTVDSKSSPRLMTFDERNKLLAEISAKSSADIAEKIRESGTIQIADALASL